MQKWEYRVITQVTHKKGHFVWEDNLDDSRSSDERLNVLGAEGWELTSTTAISRIDNSSWVGLTTGFMYCLKRPL
jgi:hypothetical protein